MNLVNKIAIIGLGYVGFPLAKSFSKFYPTVGYDIDIDLVDSINKKKYKEFLYDIDYLIKEKDDFKINTNNIDREISSIPGPQLVVPLSNKRYAINAANSRWGSLYDALYGTDIIPYKGKFKIGEYYNERRGKEVIKFAKTHPQLLLDKKERRPFY